jgi:hypothetical protein
MRLGPIAGCTLIVRSLEQSVAAYAALGFVAGPLATFPEQRALDLGDPALAGARFARLEAAAGSWLDLVEQSDAAPAGSAQGWQSLGDGESGTGSWSGPDGESLGFSFASEPPKLASLVLATPNPARSAAFYGGLGLVDWQPQDKGRVMGLLRDGHSILFVPVASGVPAAPAHRAGLRCVSLYRSDASGRRLASGDDPSARVLAGPVGEAIELV